MYICLVFKTKCVNVLFLMRRAPARPGAGLGR